jgi:hypothetical protein
MYDDVMLMQKQKQKQLAKTNRGYFPGHHSTPPLRGTVPQGS